MKRWMRWGGYVFAIAFVTLVGVNIFLEAKSGGPFSTYRWVKLEKLAQMEAGATILAKSEARTAYDQSLVRCGEIPPGDACRKTAAGAARAAAQTALLDGGCVTWEMSEWDPTRGLADRAEPKTREAAEAECAMQAKAIADRIAEWTSRAGR